MSWSFASRAWEVPHSRIDRSKASEGLKHAWLPLRVVAYLRELWWRCAYAIDRFRSDVPRTRPILVWLLGFSCLWACREVRHASV